jgi:hypothetical protein
MRGLRVLFCLSSPAKAGDPVTTGFDLVYVAFTCSRTAYWEPVARVSFRWRDS